MPIAHLAIDLGASSGRAILGVLEGSTPRLKMAELHRFQHHACTTPTGPVWDLTGIWRNILQGLGQAVVWCSEAGVELKSIGVDTWGVDWGLLGKSGELLSLPHCYRDPRNEAACTAVLDKLGGFAPLYARTGIQRLNFNTLFQVAGQFEREPQLFDAAHRLVFLPDLFHFWLSGEIATELSIASTSSMLAVDSGQWDLELLEQLGLPHHMLGKIVEPGTTVGTLLPSLAAETGAPQDVKVIAPAAHDTASAVAAVPATHSRSWAYLSSGTWSLLGAELPTPINSEAARETNLTNERGMQRTIRLLRNIAGLWLVQELQRDLAQQGTKLGFDELIREAREVQPGRTLVDPNHAEFAVPGGIQQKIARYAQDTRQPEPETPGQFVRCCLESLAFCYATTLSQLEGVLGHAIDVLHLVGGGIQNKLLNELTAAAVGRPVTTGPVEATAIGNLLVQAIGCEELADLSELRQVVADSFSVEEISMDGDLPTTELRMRYDEILAMNTGR